MRNLYKTHSEQLEQYWAAALSYGEDGATVAQMATGVLGRAPENLELLAAGALCMTLRRHKMLKLHKLATTLCVDKNNHRRKRRKWVAQPRENWVPVENDWHPQTKKEVDNEQDEWLRAVREAIRLRDQRRAILARV